MIRLKNFSALHRRDLCQDPQRRVASDFKASQTRRAMAVSAFFCLIGLACAAPFNVAMAQTDSPSFFLADATPAPASTASFPMHVPQLWVQTPTGPKALRQLMTEKASKKPVFVLFWAPSCKICVDELPEMAAQTTNPKAPFFLIPVAIQAQGDTLLQPFLKRHKTTLPLLWVETIEDLRTLPLRGLPTGFWVSEDGLISGRSEGAFSWQKSPPPSVPLG